MELNGAWESVHTKGILRIDCSIFTTEPRDFERKMYHKNHQLAFDCFMNSLDGIEWVSHNSHMGQAVKPEHCIGSAKNTFKKTKNMSRRTYLGI